MKILFIGPYRQSCGWGNASRALIQSLLTIPNIDLTLRHIYLASVPMMEDINLDKLENKVQSSYDTIIQHCLPEFFVYHPGCKNVGFFLTETRYLEFTPWIMHINMMDEIWVSSSIEAIHLRESGCNVPVYTIGEATDITKFTQLYHKNTNHNFTFYTIGEGERKNFGALILAFHSEFDRNEPVDLLIKTSSFANLQEFKASLGIYKNIHQYKNEKVITDHISDDEINKIHQQSDCFVLTSYGEAWCRPALDALGFGNTPIIPDNIGSTDFINNDNGWIIPSYETPVTCRSRPLPYLYTSRETWYQINILALRRAMREAYENKELKQKKMIKGIQDAITYSYLNIGQRLYDRLYS